jgi:hypothetical protein
MVVHLILFQFLLSIEEVKRGKGVSASPISLIDTMEWGMHGKKRKEKE